MSVLRLKSNRAGSVWLVLLLASMVVLPWYKGQPLLAGPVASAVAESLSGHGWLWPMLLVVGALGAVATRPNWQQTNGALILTLAAIALYLAQAFAVGLRGPNAGWIAALFPDAASGQPGFGWGGFIVSGLFVGLLSELFAARGFCRGERFASFAIT
ncbi:MAG: iron ABC transporter permease, partial [Pseudomonadota bacterium]